MNECSGGFSFDGMADSYDSWYETALGRTCDALERAAIEKTLPAPADGNRLLDVGCGTGHWSTFFSERNFTVAGVDISQQMIRIARGKNIANASFEVADAHALPFTDGQFDVATAIITLEFVRRPEVVVGEMARCLRHPGGVLIVGALNALASLNRKRKAADEGPYSFARLFSPAELKSLLAPYGETRVATTTFVPQSAWALPLAPLTDFLGRLLHLPYGAFMVGRTVV